MSNEVNTLPATAQAILGLLKAQGLAQGELAARLGVTAGVITRWVNGTTAPSYRSMARIVHEFDVDSRVFFEDLPPRQEDPRHPTSVAG